MVSSMTSATANWIGKELQHSLLQSHRQGRAGRNPPPARNGIFSDRTSDRRIRSAADTVCQRKRKDLRDSTHPDMRRACYADLQGPGPDHPDDPKGSFLVTELLPTSPTEQGCNYCIWPGVLLKSINHTEYVRRTFCLKPQSLYDRWRCKEKKQLF